MKLKKTKRNPLSWDSHKGKYRLNREWIFSSPERKNFGYLWSKSLTRPGSVVSQPRKPTIPWAVSKAVWAAGHTLFVSFYSPGVLNPALGCPAQEGHQPVTASAEETTRKTGMEHLTYEERLRKLVLFSLDKRRLWRVLRAAFHYLKGHYKKAGEKLLTRGNGLLMKKDRFILDIRKNFFTIRMVSMKQIAQGSLAAPALEVFKNMPDGALSYLI